MVDKETIQSFMKEFISHMMSTHPQYYQGDTINLDFHSISHYGEKSEMDDNWVGAKHQRLKSALTLFAQDGESDISCMQIRTSIEKMKRMRL